VADRRRADDSRKADRRAAGSSAVGRPATSRAAASRRAAGSPAAGTSAGTAAGDSTATILHADLDAFYASVEQLLDPSLQGRPIAVGAGVVLAASYEARSFGVSAGMPGWRARQLCPGLTFVPGHFREYQRLGDEVMEILGAFTPLVERISIDEAFLDVAGATHLFGPPATIGAAIRGRVRHEIGLPLSIGAARTKHLAKVASQVAKPNGMVVVAAGAERAFLEHLPVGLIWGVGPVRQAQLARAGIRTVGQLAAVDSDVLENLLGKGTGGKLGALAGNIDPRRVESPRSAASIGAQAALGRRRATPELLHSALGYLADRVAGRLRASGRAARTVTVRVRFPGMRSVTRSATVRPALSETLTLTELAVELAVTALAQQRDEPDVSLLAVSVSNLVDPVLQLELPLPLPSPAGASRQRSSSREAVGTARWLVDRSVDGIRARFGRGAVGYATVVFSDMDRVPEAFRELAEHGPATGG
jgi:DNA polymerase IV